MDEFWMRFFLSLISFILFDKLWIQHSSHVAEIVI
jgi:hypothetical protein